MKERGRERLDNVSKFKYLACGLDESGTDVAECCKKVVSGRKVAGATRSLINFMGLPLGCAKILHNKLFVPVLIDGSETVVWRKKERSRIRENAWDAAGGRNL